MANKTYWVELENGHRLLAFTAGKAKTSGLRFVPGDKVNLELSPYDLSEGRIVVKA